MQKITNYFENTKKYSKLRYILELTLIAFILKIFFVYIGVSLGHAFHFNTQPDLAFEEKMARSGLLVIAIITTIFALIETLIGQWLILSIASKFTKKTEFKILASAVVFTLLHVEPILMFAVFPIGLILAWTFLIYRRKSLWEALFVTTAVHVLHNFIALGLVYLSLAN